VTIHTNGRGNNMEGTVIVLGYILISVAPGQNPIISPDLQTPIECGVQEKFMQQTYPKRETWCEPIEEDYTVLAARIKDQTTPH
jgi:hypothetical protein